MYKVIPPNNIEGSIDNNWHVVDDLDTHVICCFGFAHSTDQKSKELAEDIAALLNIFGPDVKATLSKSTALAKAEIKRRGTNINHH